MGFLRVAYAEAEFDRACVVVHVARSLVRVFGGPCEGAFCNLPRDLGGSGSGVFEVEFFGECFGRPGCEEWKIYFGELGVAVCLVEAYVALGLDFAGGLCLSGLEAER